MGNIHQPTIPMQQPLVAAIGGVFIYSKEPKALADWYQRHLGLPTQSFEEHNLYLHTFQYKDAATGKEYQAVWSIMKNNNRPHLEGKVFTVNYRVSDIDATVAHIRALGTEVKGIEDAPEGRFAWLNDLDGNFIELWEDTTVG